MKARMNHVVESRFADTCSTQISHDGGQMSLSVGIALAAFTFVSIEAAQYGHP